MLYVDVDDKDFESDDRSRPAWIVRSFRSFLGFGTALTVSSLSLYSLNSADPFPLCSHI